MLGCAILPGNVQDRDGCLGVLRQVRRLFPFLERVIADGAYQGKETARAGRRAARARLEIVKRSDAAKGFVVPQKRWVVEQIGRASWRERVENSVVGVLLKKKY